MATPLDALERATPEQLCAEIMRRVQIRWPGVTREWVDKFIQDKLEFYDTAYDGAMKMLAELGIEVTP